MTWKTYTVKTRITALRWYAVEAESAEAAEKAVRDGKATRDGDDELVSLVVLSATKPFQWE